MKNSRAGRGDFAARVERVRAATFDVCFENGEIEPELDALQLRERFERGDLVEAWDPDAGQVCVCVCAARRGVAAAVGSLALSLRGLSLAFARLFFSPLSRADAPRSLSLCAPRDLPTSIRLLGALRAIDAWCALCILHALLAMRALRSLRPLCALRPLRALHALCTLHALRALRALRALHALHALCALRTVHALRALRALQLCTLCALCWLCALCTLCALCALCALCTSHCALYTV